MARVLLFLLSSVASLVGAQAAHALASAPITTPHARVRLVSDVDAVEPGKPFRLGLHFQLAKGWHIYWVNPGTAGEPPQLDLSLPQGAKASGIAWPTPLRVPEGPVMTYSYLDEALLPVTVTAPSGLSSFPITAKASWLICGKICVPEEGSLRLDLPVGAASPSAEAPLFAAADARIPRPSPYAASVSPDATLLLTGEGLSPDTVREAWFLPGAWGQIDDLAPQTLSVTKGRLTLALKAGQTFDPKAALSGVLVVKGAAGKENFLTITATPEAGGATPAVAPPAPQAAQRWDAPAPTQGAHLSGVALLAFAFLGGLILNLMPCVFPILAMKAVGVAKLSCHARGAVRVHAASYTLGVLVAFAALGVLLLALRAAGLGAPWGIQFQSPIFVAATAWLLFAVGLNLSGVFELGGRFANAGGALTRLGGYAGSFFTGLLAVLVATPCTAPFMGAAVAAATTAPPTVTMLVFLVMGLGLATPYGLLGLVPGAARLLPRPGRWMLILKQALAFPMYGAAVWLVWVVSQQAGADGVLAALSGAVLVGFAAWLIGATQGDEGRTRLFARAAATAAVIGAFILLGWVSAAPPSSATTASSSDEVPYSAKRLAALRAEGRPVFVNMTAAWCVTCLVNERVALSSEAVKRAFAERNVAYLKGDWTRADPAISQFLREHGRDGVPLYVLFPPNGRPPVILPQVLTASAVLAELDRTGS
jgi:thiol:disulfide interchange protein/DsbC/DsbD-like thiol-disulfide interchange protein